MGRWERKLRTELVEVEASVKAARDGLMGLKLELVRGSRGKMSKISLEWKGGAYRSNVRVVSMGGGEGHFIY